MFVELLRVIVLALQDLDLEGDWDPDAHDRQMAGIYAQAGDEEFYDEEKPTWDDDIDIDDIVPSATSSKKERKKRSKGKEKGKTAGDEDEDYDMDEGDEAYREDGDWGDEGWDGTEETRKRKVQEYMDSLFELEFNDVVSAAHSRCGDHLSDNPHAKVAGIPTRFKYTTTAPQAFGLTPTEILMADDKDLNQYMGIKKYAPYRKGGNWDGQRPERLKEFRDKLSSRKANKNGEDGEVQVKKRKGKKERQKAKGVTAAEGAVPELGEPQAGGKEKKRKLEELSETVQTQAGLEAHSSKKRKRRHKKSLQTASAE